MSVWIKDKDHWFLWLPVLFGLGIHLFFQGWILPPVILWMGCIVSILGIYLLRKTVLVYMAIGILCVILGAGCASFRTHKISLEYHRLNASWSGYIQATVSDIEVMDQGLRIILSNVNAQGLDLRKIRINFKYKKDKDYQQLSKNLDVGCHIRAYVRLFPIPVRETKLNYDFEFWSYFQGIEAVGFGGASSIQITETSTNTNLFDRLRYGITYHIRSLQLGQVGEIAIALITGYRNGIHSQIKDDFAGSGIAHILAISGLHLSLIGGLMFFLLRRGLGLYAPLALHYPLKKIAAGLAIFGCFFYLKISGDSIPATRAFIMFVFIMGGIILDRDPISLRSVGWAAILILMLRPESLYSASFQMSFAAVVGLIGCYEYVRHQGMNLSSSSNQGWLRNILRYFGGSVLSSIIASIATLPFILHTFHRFSWHSVEANLIAIPLMSFWIMPLAIVVVITIPFGLHAIPMTAMGWGIHILIQLAHEVNHWPGSFVPVGLQHEWFMPLLLIGVFWTLIWTHKWRWLGIPLIFLAFLLPQKGVFLMVSHNLDRIGILAGEKILLTQTGRSNFVTQNWKAISGASEVLNLSKAKSSWVTQVPGGWKIQPFVKDPKFYILVLTTVDTSFDKADVKVYGFPKLKSIQLKDGRFIQGGSVLCRDTFGHIHIIHDDDAACDRYFPWRQ